VFKIGRLVFFGVFGVFTIGFLYWESFTLINMQPKGVVLGEKTTHSGNTGQVLISDAKAAENNNMEIVSSVNGDDARPLIIKKYLEKYHSPMAPYADLIYQVSQTYGYEYYWIVAIAQQESNLCKVIPEDSHNCWGYGIHKKGTLKFDNYELAIKSYGEYLKREYFDKGLNTPELIMKKYCPSSNGSWAKGVRQFIDEMESGNF
jgi:hypothetical protein